MQKGYGRKGKKNAARGASLSDRSSFFGATHGNMKGKKKAKLGYMRGKRKKGV